MNPTHSSSSEILKQSISFASQGNLEGAMQCLQPLKLGANKNQAIKNIFERQECRDIHSLRLKIVNVIVGEDMQSQSKPPLYPRPKPPLPTRRKGGTPLLTTPWDLRRETIFLGLSVKDILACSQACTTLNQELKNGFFWQSIYRRDFGIHEKEIPLMESFQDFKDSYAMQRNFSNGVHSGSKIVASPGKPISCFSLFDGKIFLGFEKGEIEIRDLKTGRCIRSFVGHEKEVTSLVFHNWKLYSGSSDKTIKVWDIFNGKHLSTFDEKNAKDIKSIIIDDGKLYSISYDNKIRIWNADTREFLGVLEIGGNKERVTAFIVWEGKLCSGSSDGLIQIWDPTENKCLATFKAHEKGIASFSVCNGKLCSASTDGTVKIWDTTGKCLHTFEEDDSKGDFLFKLCGRLCAYTPGRNINILNIETGERLWTLEVSRYIFRSFAASEGKLYALNNSMDEEGIEVCDFTAKHLENSEKFKHYTILRGLADKYKEILKTLDTRGESQLDKELLELPFEIKTEIDALLKIYSKGHGIECLGTFNLDLDAGVKAKAIEHYLS